MPREKSPTADGNGKYRMMAESAGRESDMMTRIRFWFITLMVLFLVLAPFTVQF